MGWSPYLMGKLTISIMFTGGPDLPPMLYKQPGKSRLIIRYHNRYHCANVIFANLWSLNLKDGINFAMSFAIVNGYRIDAVNTMATGSWKVPAAGSPCMNLPEASVPFPKIDIDNKVCFRYLDGDWFRWIDTSIWGAAADAQFAIFHTSALKKHRLPFIFAACLDGAACKLKIKQNLHTGDQPKKKG